MKRLRWAVPAALTGCSVRALLGATLHEHRWGAIDDAFRAGRVRVEGRQVEDGRRAARRGETIEVELGAPPEVPARAATLLAHIDAQLFVDKPSGVLVHDDGSHGEPPAWLRRFASSWPTLLPAHRLDRPTSGVLVLCTDAAALATWSERFARRDLEKEYRAVVSPAPKGERGEIEGADEGGRPMRLSWERLSTSDDGSRAELRCLPHEGRNHQVRRLLASAGFPIVGDYEHGPLVGRRELRLALHHRRLRWDGGTVQAPMPMGWGDLLAPCGSPKRPSVRISDASARILGQGHPWVLRDRDTGSTGHLSAGTLVELVDRLGQAHGTAVIDGPEPLCARAAAPHAGGWRQTAERAIDRRQGLIAAPETDCVRLVHGEADGMPGLWVDRWAGVVVATVHGAAAETMVGAAIEAARDRLGPLPCFVQQHPRDLRARGGGEHGARLEGRWWDGEGEAAEGAEFGLRYGIDPIGTLSTGLYPDHRDTRRRLRTEVAGRRVANLFAHTGAFSAVALAGGAAFVESVDLSARWLAVLGDNLRRNGLESARHSSRKLDAPRWAEERSEPFDVIIVDPPAFARGGGSKGDWSTRRDLPSLLVRLAGRLSKDGELIVSANHKDLDPSWLRGQIEAAFPAERLDWRRVLPAEDRPDVPGFPEGRAFVSWWVRRRPNGLPPRGGAR